MKEYLIKNKETNKYYNFITKNWTNCPTYACLTHNANKINELSVIYDIEIIPCIDLCVRESVIDEVLVFA